MAKERNWKPFAVLHKIADHLVNYYSKYKDTEGLKEIIYSEMLKETAKWCEEYNNKYNKWIQDKAIETLESKLKLITHE